MKHDVRSTVVLGVMTVLTAVLGMLFVGFVDVPRVAVMPSWLYPVVLVTAMVGGLGLWLFMIRRNVNIQLVFSVVVTALLAQMLYGVTGYVVVTVIVATMLGVLYNIGLKMVEAGINGRRSWISARKWVLVTSVLFVLGAAWLGASLGSRVSPLVAVVLLAVLAVWDAYAVYVSKRMVVVAKTFIGRGIIPGAGVGKVKWRDFALVGGGDLLFLALIPASLVASGDVVAGVVAAFGLWWGLAVLFVFGKRDRMYPALPSMLFGLMAAMLGYSVVLAIVNGVYGV